MPLLTHASCSLCRRPAANYLEAADLETTTTGAGNTANTFTDGLTVDGTFLPLNQFHFHSPSEHTVNGMHYPLEMHMVHKLFKASATDATIVPANTPGAVLSKAAVIGIMFAYRCARCAAHALRRIYAAALRMCCAAPALTRHARIARRTRTTSS